MSIIIRPFFRSITFLVAIVFLWSIAVWIASGFFAEEQMEQLIGNERLEANASVDLINTNLKNRLVYVRSIPIIMATEPSLISLLMRFGSDVKPSELMIKERREKWSADPEQSRISDRLSQIVAEIELNSLFVLNAAGDCVAEGHLPEDTAFIGTNYADRQYFLSSRSGQNGIQFAVGRVSNHMGLFYSSPVFSNGKFIGAIAVRINIDHLLPLVTEQNAFVTDENDVIILTRDPTLLMRVLPHGKINGVGVEDREKRYKRKEFETLDITNKSGYTSHDMVLYKSQLYPYVMATRSNSEDQINLYVLRDMNVNAKRIHQDRLRWFYLLSVLGFLLVLLVFGSMKFVIKNRAHRQTLIDHSNELQHNVQQLEQEISERKRTEQEKESLILNLQNAIVEIKTLSGLLPICSYCKRIRDDKGYWNQIEAYIHDHSEAEFSHSICKECAKKHYPDMDLYDE